MARERAINAPGVVLLVTAALLTLFAVQTQIVGLEAWNTRFGLNAANLTNGRGWTLISYMGAHGSWAHVGMNAVGVLAFGAPLARRLGEGIGGWIAYLVFFLIGGVLSGLGFVLLNRDSEAILVGASGAVFALVGAATRLMSPGHRLLPLFSRPVLTMTAVWVGSNLLIAFLGADPTTGTRGVAWEAHIIGLAVGLLLTGPWVTMFGKPVPQPRPAPIPGAVSGALSDGESDPRAAPPRNRGPWDPA